MNELRRLGLEAGPLLVFFAGHYTLGIIPATGLFVVAAGVAFGLSIWLERRVPVMPLIGFVFIGVFGGLTVLLENDLFIKIRPTITNLFLAAILLAGLIFRRNYLALLLGGMIQLDDAGWRILTRRWIGFFVVLAGLNEAAWRSLPTDWWVNFKVFAMMPLTLIFAMAQMPLLMRHQIAPADGGGESG